MFIKFIRGAIKEPKNRNPENRSVVVYGLASSEDGKIRYIGQTAQALAKRFSAHFSYPVSKRNSMVNRWISSVRQAGFRVLCFVIESDAIWNDTETRWIAWYLKQGTELVNTTVGGSGTLGHKVSAEIRAKISAGLKGKRKSQDHVAKIRANGILRRGVKLPPEFGAKVSMALKGRRPKNLESLWAKSRNRPWSEDQRRATMAAHAARKEANHVVS